MARNLYREIEHHSGYAGPEPGTPEYHALSGTGQRWADAGMVPADFDDFDYSTPTTRENP